MIGIDPTTAEVTFDTKIGVHDNGELTELPAPTTVLPGLLGGVLTPHAVAGGVVYTPVVNAPSEQDPAKVNFLAGAALGSKPGQLVAVDASNGDIVWDTEIDGDPFGGALVLGDLVVTGTFQGKIVVVDRATGDIVRTFDAPGRHQRLARRDQGHDRVAHRSLDAGEPGRVPRSFRLIQFALARGVTRVLAR